MELAAEGIPKGRENWFSPPIRVTSQVANVRFGDGGEDKDEEFGVLGKARRIRQEYTTVSPMG